MGVEGGRVVGGRRQSWLSPVAAARAAGENSNAFHPSDEEAGRAGQAVGSDQERRVSARGGQIQGVSTRQIAGVESKGGEGGRARRREKKKGQLRFQPEPEFGKADPRWASCFVSARRRWSAFQPITLPTLRQQLCPRPRSNASASR